MNIKEIIKHFRTQAQSRFNPSPDGSRETYYNGRKDAYNDCADILERYTVKYPNGWHPVSEPPKESGVYVVITDFYSCQTATFAKYDKDKGWDTADIEWWCYPPKED